VSRCKGHLWMAKNIAKQIEFLACLKRAEFRALWREYFGQELENPSRGDVLIRLRFAVCACNQSRKTCKCGQIADTQIHTPARSALAILLRPQEEL
jgi:hypothetical protein